MRKAFLYIILTLLLSMSCTQKEPATYMLRPHEELPKEIASDRSFTKIFLAGTIDMGNSRDWQMELHDRFSRMDGRYILFNPRQEHWDASRPGEMDYQVRWELDHLEEADIPPSSHEHPETTQKTVKVHIPSIRFYIQHIYLQNYETILTSDQYLLYNKICVCVQGL